MHRWLALGFVLAFGIAEKSFARESSATTRPLHLQLHPPEGSVTSFEVAEFVIDLPREYADRFDPNEVSVDLEIEEASGRRLSVPAFFYQPYTHQQRKRDGRLTDWYYPDRPAGWRARFAPVQAGRYRAWIEVEDDRGHTFSPAVHFECQKGKHRGFLRVSSSDPRFFGLSTGQAFFPIGQNLAFIGEGQQVTPSRVSSIFDDLARHGANYVRIWAGCKDWALAIEARKSAWGRSWDWDPPFVSDPANPGSGRQCVRLTSERDNVVLNPTHPVALRADTTYVLTGEARVSEGARMALELNHSPVLTIAPAPSGEWGRFEYSWRSDPETYWLPPLAFRLEGRKPAWLRGLSLWEAGGGAELLWEAAIPPRIRGFYNPVDSFQLDQILESANAHGIYIQLSLLNRDLYMKDLEDPSSHAYSQAIHDAKNLFRYAVARWGGFRSLGVWEYWNEMNPNLPTGRFYTEVGTYLQRIDIYHHLRSTSAWGPAPKDYRHPELDLADLHFYLRPTDAPRLTNEVEAVIDRAAWLRDQAPERPALLGEFGLADDRWRITEEMKRHASLADVHNALWASALSGLSGTCLPWWWERTDQRNGYSLYEPLSRFLAEIPWNSGNLETFQSTVPESECVVAGWKTEDHAWIWIFDPRAAWKEIIRQGDPPLTVPDQILEIPGMAEGSFEVKWWDTRTGKIRQRNLVSDNTSLLRLQIPRFKGDVACRITLLPPSP